jgi:CBS domain-containing protein
VSPDENIDECLFLMKEFGFRHLPVCNDKQLKGLISLRDLLLRNADRKGISAA